ncbi:hypothetical protein [Nocardioides sp. YIM 152588]|uniref:hypothetical protein n=1 Tax=Nocardioides sp. YIM 152588 TaxID=3158259 RepID=UPI0032E437A1
MTQDATDSSAYAADVARLLWPAPWGEPRVTRGAARGRGGDGVAHRDAYLFPNARRPRLLVPADVPASSVMLQRLGNGRGALVAPLRDLAERSVRSRAFGLARWPVLRVPAAGPGADSVERYLGERLGTEVRVGVLLGTRRVNQKPVLQVFGLDGALVAYAKVGHNDLTAQLVGREAASLTAVADLGPRTFRLPRLLHHGAWAGLAVMAISPLPTDPRRPVPAAVREAAMREVAELGGTVAAPLAESGFWDRIRRSTRTLPEGPGRARLRAVVQEVHGGHGATDVRLGGWHGDWGHWNMGMKGDELQLWDWERYDPQVPVGFDALHFVAQAVRPGSKEDRRQEEGFLGSVPASLAAMGVPADRHDLVLRLYLVEMASRYLDALRHGATPALRRRTDWVLSLLERLADTPHPQGAS